MKFRFKQGTSTYWILIIVISVELVMASQVLGSDEVSPKLPAIAPCAVCSVSGSTEKHPVRSWSKYQGEVFYFRSVDCKKEFDRDPLAVILGPIPRPLPDFVAQTLKGKNVDLKSKKYKKKLMLIDFWATWCLPCLESIPELNQIQKKYKKKLTVLGISLDTGQRAEGKVKKVVKEKKASYPIWLAKSQSSAFEAFNLKSVPTMFLVNRKQQIVAQWMGKVNHEKIEKAIETELNATAEK